MFFRNKVESQNERLIQDLMAIVGSDAVLYKHADLLAYECDGFTLQRALPRAVVLPSNTEEVSRVVKYLHDAEIPFLARGAGSGLSGGSIPIHGEVIISLVRMKKLLHIDYENRYAVVQPGLINLNLSKALEQRGYHYAPDPSSQSICTIGGNVAENAGGAHCFKYGVTTNHVLGLEFVLPTGEIVRVGEGGIPDLPGYDLVGILHGSEGTLAIVTEITVKIMKKPEGHKTVLAYFDDIAHASQAVADIIAAGIVPVALEMMDKIAIEAVESAAFPVGHPPGLEALLLIEVDGIAAGIDEQIEEILDVCRRNHVTEVRAAANEEERAKWWANRKTGFGAMGAISSDYLVQDGCIPPSTLPSVLKKIDDISRETGLRIANIFHAGDGNIHPLILFDARTPGEQELALEAGSACLKICAEAGGSITGEHGVGVEKREEMRFIFSEEELAAQIKLRDQVFNPKNLLNRGKGFPEPKSKLVVNQHS